jgi:hypothetical protein
MGDCMSSNSNSQRSHSNPNTSAPIRANEHRSPTVPAKTPILNPTPLNLNTDAYKINNLTPILRPVLPKGLMNPQSHPMLGNKITLVPNEFLEIKVKYTPCRFLKTLLLGLSSSGVSKKSMQFLNKLRNSQVSRSATEVSSKSSAGSVLTYKNTG